MTGVTGKANNIQTPETDWKPFPRGFCTFDPGSDPDPERMNNLLGEVALIKLINFNRVAPGIARSNNCRGLLTAPGEARTSALWLCRLSQGASKRAMEISAFSCSCKGNAR